MNRTRIAQILYYCIVLVSIVFGVAYMLTPKIMPYHQHYLGVPHEALPPRMAFLLLTEIRVMGGAMLAVGITLVILASVLFRTRDKWIWLAILVLVSIPMTITMLAALQIGIFTPWWVLAIVLVLFAVAQGLSYSVIKNG